MRSAALERFPSLWALLMLATLPPLQAEAGPPPTQVRGEGGPKEPLETRHGKM